jgi:hypothetical protein
MIKKVVLALSTAVILAVANALILMVAKKLGEEPQA